MGRKICVLCGNENTPTIALLLVTFGQFLYLSLNPLEIELVPIRSDALSLRNYAATELDGDVGERRVLLAGIKLIDRILDTERARQNQEQANESSELSSRFALSACDKMRNSNPDFTR